MKWIVALSFFAFGLWALKPDKRDEDKKLMGTGVFMTTLVDALDRRGLVRPHGNSDLARRRQDPLRPEIPPWEFD